MSFHLGLNVFLLFCVFSPEILQVLHLGVALCPTRGEGDKQVSDSLEEQNMADYLCMLQSENWASCHQN